MWYEYRCEECGTVHESQMFARVGEDHPELCCCVGAQLTRMFSSEIQTTRPFEPYYNYAVGEVVQNDRHYRQILKRKSDEHSERSGTTVNLQPVYPMDMVRDHGKDVGVIPTDEYEDQRRTRHDKLVAEGKKLQKKLDIV